MALKKLVAATLLAATMLSAPAEAARRRAVRVPIAPVTPVAITQPVSAVLPASGTYLTAEKHISLANHSDAEKKATLCHVINATPGAAAGCKEYTIPAQHTVLVDAAKDFRIEGGVLTISADTDKLEIRNSLLAKPLDKLLGEGTTNHLLGPEDFTRQAASATLYTTEASTIRLTLRDKYGTPLGEKTETLGPFSVKHYDYFTSFNAVPQDDTSLEIRVESGRAGATLSTWDKDGRTPSRRDLREGALKQYALLDAQDSLNLKNLNTNNASNILIDRYKTGQDNHQQLERTSYRLVNSENASLEGLFIDNGAVLLEGGTPFLASSTRTSNGYTNTIPALAADQAAIGLTNDADQNKLLIESQHSFATTGNMTVDLINTAPGPISVRITNYTPSGTIASETVKPLKAYEHAVVPLGNVNGRVTVDPENNNSIIVPRVLSFATITNENESYTLEPYVLGGQQEKVTGEDYVNRWFIPLQEQYMFWNNRETKNLLNSSNGEQLLRLLYNTSGSTRTEEEFVRAYQGLADGNPNNGQLYRPRDPGYFDFRPGKAMVCFEIESQGNRSCITVPDNKITSARGFLRNQAIVNIDDAPQEYGGTAATGANLDYNPTWIAQNPN